MRQPEALHLLVNNAGMMRTRPERSAVGIQLTFATNHLGPFMLTELLLDLPRASAPARKAVGPSAQVHGS